MYYSKKKHCTNPQKIWKRTIQKLLVGKHNVKKGFRSGSLPHIQPGTAGDGTSVHTHAQPKDESQAEMRLQSPWARERG